MTASQPPFLFIVGDTDPGRDLLRRLFDGHPDIAVAPNYPFVFKLAQRRAEFEGPEGARSLARAISRDERFGPWGLDADGLAALFGPDPIDIADAFRATYAHLASARGARLYADCSNWTLRQMLPLTLLFPEARFVHVVEDPRILGARLAREGDSIGRVIERWRSAIELALDAEAALPAAAVTRIRYEDLIQDPRGHAKTIAENLGLGIDPEGIPDERPESSPAPKPLTDELRTVEMLAGPIMRKLGYEPRTGARALSYDQRKRLVGELQAGRRAGLNEPLGDKLKHALGRVPALNKALRGIVKKVKR